MLFYLDSKDRTALERVEMAQLPALGWKEKDLENLLANHLEILVSETDLMVIHQEAPRKEEPDIMALDEEANLHIFELKVTEAHEEHLLQVLRYGQRFGQCNYDEIEHYYSRYLERRDHRQSSPDLARDHQQYFGLSRALDRAAFNRKQRFVVVTNGLDLRTRQAIAYWNKQNLPVGSLIYRVYKTRGGESILEFDPYTPSEELLESVDEGYFIVNTNVTYFPDAWRDLLGSSKAAAWYDKKWGIDRIHKGDVVFLYHTGVGIIAVGRAKTDRRRADYQGDKDEEHYVLCEFEATVNPLDPADRVRALPPWEINRELGTGHRFRQSVFALPPEQGKKVQEMFTKRARRPDGSKLMRPIPRPTGAIESPEGGSR